MHWIDENRSGQVEQGTGWKIQASTFHIYEDALHKKWLRANNTAAVRRISRFTPIKDYGLSISWELRFYLNNPLDTFIFWCMSTLENVDETVAGNTGYYLYASGLLNFYYLIRSDGGGVTANVITSTPAITSGIEYTARITREISGANRNWRIYLDDVQQGATTNEATYTTGEWIGYNLNQRNRVTDLIIEQ